MNNVEYFFAAYAVFWLVQLLYLRTIDQRQKTIQKRLNDLFR